MTNKEASAIIRKEYLCIDRDCDIERSCGRCDLMMPSKEPILEAFRMAMDLLEENATTKDCLGVDLISRQAVLDLAKFDDRDGLGAIIHAFDVERLPSVNPTKTGNADCHECKTEHDCYECEKYKENEE